MNDDLKPVHEVSRWKTIAGKPVSWFTLALLIRLLYLLEQGGTSPLFYQPLLDEKEAFDSAMAILQGTVPAEPYFKAPGYSWIMAAVIWISADAWPWTLRGLQHVCGAWMVGMAAWMAGRLSPAGSWRRGAVAVAGLMGALYAPIIRLENNISLDFWAAFFQSGMLCLLTAAVVSQRRHLGLIAGAGVIAAAAWLMRPTLTLVLPFLALWVFCVIARGRVSSWRDWRDGIKLAVLFLVPVTIAAGSVVARNAVVSGETMALPWQGGYNLYYANRPGATGRYLLQDQVVETEHANPTRHLAVVDYYNQLNRDEQRKFRETPNYGKVNSWWFEKSMKAIADDPAAWLELMGRKAVYLFNDKEIYNYEDFDLQRSRSGLLKWMPGRFGVVFPLALIAVVALWRPGVRRRRDVYGLLWLYVITLGGAIALYYVSGRMRMPISFPLIALAGCGVGSICGMKMSARVAAAVVVMAGAVVSWGDWWGVRNESMAHVDLARMSNAAWHQGKNEQALKLVLEAEKLAPDYPTLPQLKGQAYYGMGRYKDSLREFERSIKVLGDGTSRRNAEVVREELRALEREVGKKNAADTGTRGIK